MATVTNTQWSIVYFLFNKIFRRFLKAWESRKTKTYLKKCNTCDSGLHKCLQQANERDENYLNGYI